MAIEVTDKNALALWEKAKAIYLLTLENESDKGQAERYFGMITSVSCEDDVFTFLTLNTYSAEFLQREYCEKLQHSLMLVDGSKNWKLVFKMDENAQKPAATPSNVLEQYALPNSGGTVPQQRSTFVSTMPLREEYSFAEFVEGPSNSFALSAAKGVVHNPGRIGFNPLFIHGGTGLGKTHLMQAIGNELKRRHPNLSICYLTAETFMNEYINSLRSGQIESFRKKYRSLDLLLLDDVQFFQRGQEVQAEFFNTFTALQGAYKQIVMTSDVAPKNLPAIEARLISRFEGGMVQEVESPSIETRLAILRKKCEANDYHVPDFVLEFIAENINSHVRAMEGALAKVSVYLQAGMPTMLDKTMLNHLLRDFIAKEESIRKITLEEIIETCAKKYAVTHDEIMSHERTQSLVTPRQMAMYIARKYTARSLKEIAAAFGKSHATIINGARTMTERLANEKDLKNNLEEILTSLGCKMSDTLA